MGVLTVFLDKATGLADEDGIFNKSDPYCTLTMKKDNIVLDKDVGQYKSAVKKGKNPEWGETYTFTIPNLDGHYLHISIKDEDIGKDDMLGWCDIELDKVDGLSGGGGPVEVEKIVDRNIIAKHGKLFVKLSWAE